MPAQTGVPLTSTQNNSTAAAAPAEQDPLNRLTPRDSIVNFLEACHASNLTRASRYLDLRSMSANERNTRGPELASELANVLDRHAQFDVGRLSNVVQGDLSDNLPMGFDELETFDVDGRQIELKLQRVQLREGGIHVWLVSADSVQQIPELSATIGESRIEKLLPAWFVRTKLLGTSVWVWIALLLLAFVLNLIWRAVLRFGLSLAAPVLSKHWKAMQPYRLESFRTPLRLILTSISFQIGMVAIAPSALLRMYITKAVVLVFYVGVAGLLMALVDVISDHIHSRLDARQRAISFSVLPLFVRVAKVLIFSLAVLTVLSQWGYNTNTILAGIGVGGLAVALASQKTIENLFGGVSVILDRPVLVGDFCNFGGQVGTIEDIGLRSTRIRTLDRTIVTIPNSQFSTLTLENYARRDQMWFHPSIYLHVDTRPEQIEEAMTMITNVLKEAPDVDPTGVPLRFTEIAKDYFKLEIFSYVLTDDFDRFLQAQSKLLLEILKGLNRLNIKLARPLQEAIVSGRTAGDPILTIQGNGTPDGMPQSGPRRA